MRLLSILLFFLIIGACSNRGAYEAFQSNNRNACFQLPLSQRDDCLKQTSKTFNQYERELREASVTKRSQTDQL